MLLGSGLSSRLEEPISIQYDCCRLLKPFISVSFLCIQHYGRFIRSIITRRKQLYYFLLFVFASIAWSVRPDLSLRRGVGLVVTVVFAAYLVIRYDEQARMRVLSYSLATAGIGSALFVMAFPGDGIMHFRELTGDWRGVFVHKNGLGATMAAAIFIELYLILRTAANIRRFLLIVFFIAMVVMARSATSIVVSVIYIVLGLLYAIGIDSKRGALLAILLFIGIAYVCIASLMVNPDIAFSILGKDPTLTGRTAVWEIVLPLIREKLLLGYGYHAMWAVDDPVTIAADRAVGGWGLTGSHNAFLEITLQLGLVGLALILALMGIAFVRALNCWRTIPGPLGFFTLIYLIGALLEGQAMEMLGQNQTTEWLIFNILLFSCGAALQQPRFGRPAPSDGRQQPQVDGGRYVLR